jgi:hypothetical protein
MKKLLFITMAVFAVISAGMRVNAGPQEIACHGKRMADRCSWRTAAGEKHGTCKGADKYSLFCSR